MDYITLLFLSSLLVNIGIGTYLAQVKLYYYPWWIRALYVLPSAASMFTIGYIYVGYEYHAYLPDLVRAISVTVLYLTAAKALGGEWLSKYRPKVKPKIKPKK